MTTAAMKVMAALLLSGMGITAGPVPVPNPLFHEPLYPELGPAYPVPNSIFSERNAYPHRESNPYLPESLLPDVDGPFSEGDLYSEDDLAPGGDLTPDGLALTNAERGQLLGLLSNDLGAVEGDDYSPLGYGLPQPVDPDWYEALGLVSPYDTQDAEDEYEDYMDEVNSWPQTNEVPQMVAEQSLGMSKKAHSGSAAAAGQTSPGKPAASAADNDGDDDGDDGDDDDDSDSEDIKDTTENLVKQIEDLRKSIKKAQSQGAHSIPSLTRHSSVPTPVSSTATTSATPAAVQPEESGQSGSGEAPLVDQLRAAAAKPTPAAKKPFTESETAYETIKRFLVMEDALKRLPKKTTKKAKRFVSDPFTQQLEDLRTVRT